MTTQAFWVVTCSDSMLTLITMGIVRLAEIGVMSLSPCTRHRLPDWINTKTNATKIPSRPGRLLLFLVMSFGSTLVQWWLTWDVASSFDKTGSSLIQIWVSKRKHYEVSFSCSTLWRLLWYVFASMSMVVVHYVLPVCMDSGGDPGTSQSKNEERG